MTPWSTPAGREQLWRVGRLLAITLGTSAVVVNLVNAWEIRYPLLGVAIGLCEVIYRTVYPTVAADAPFARHAAPTTAVPVVAAPVATASGPSADQVYTPVTQSPVVQSAGERPDSAPPEKN